MAGSGRAYEDTGIGVGHALISQLMTNLSTLNVETVRTEITWNNFGLLDFLAKHGFTPCQRRVLSRRVEEGGGPRRRGS